MIPHELTDPAFGESLSSADRCVVVAIYQAATELLLEDPTATGVDIVVTQAQLAERAGVSRSSVVRALPWLRDLGLLKCADVIVGEA